MSTRTKAAGKTGQKGITATAAEIVSGAVGLKQLIAIPFPVEVSTELHEKLQTLRFAASPLEDARDALVKKYAKRKRGQIVYGDKPGQVVIDPNRLAKFNAEFETWSKQKRVVAIEPVRRSEIPHKVNGEDVILAGAVFDQLGPFLVP
jgi:hypothetical protein